MQQSSYSLPLYGGFGMGNSNPQSQATTATASSTNAAPNSGASPGSLGWWLALVGGLIVVRVIYEVKGKSD